MRPSELTKLLAIAFKPGEINIRNLRRPDLAAVYAAWQSRTYPGGRCSRCGSFNQIVNQCKCDADNLPTKIP